MLTLSELPYDYDALADFIDEQTMRTHHGKHHQAYTDKANAALQGTDFADATPREILTNLDKMPADKKQAIINNVGGYCNHNFFWLSMSPNGGGNPTGDLAAAIDETFGSFEAFQKQFADAAANQFGSGWAWLVIDSKGQLKVISTANQDSPLSQGYNRILGLDVWEHAYYLTYQNRRPDYVTAFWNVVNWDQCNEWFAKGGV